MEFTRTTCPWPSGRPWCFLPARTDVAQRCRRLCWGTSLEGAPSSWSMAWSRRVWRFSEAVFGAKLYRWVAAVPVGAWLWSGESWFLGFTLAGVRHQGPGGERGNRALLAGPLLCLTPFHSGCDCAGDSPQPVDGALLRYFDGLAMTVTCLNVVPTQRQTGATKCRLPLEAASMTVGLEIVLRTL